MPCPIWNKVKAPEPGTSRVASQQFSICGKKSEIFLRVHYKELLSYLEGEGKYDDVFGLCASHGPKFSSDVKQWTKSVEVINGRSIRRVISGLRGRIDLIEVIPQDGTDLVALTREDKHQRIMASVKREIKRKMNQVNTRNLTIDHWRQAFQEILEEFVVESVQDS